MNLQPVCLLSCSLCVQTTESAESSELWVTLLTLADPTAANDFLKAKQAVREQTRRRADPIYCNVE